MYPRKEVITITTAADGTGTFYSNPITGFVKMVKLAIGTLTTGIDLTLTTEETLQTVLVDTAPTDAEIFYPRALFNVNTTGAAGTGDDMDTQGIPVVNERLKLVVANGGVSMSGTLTVIYA